MANHSFSALVSLALAVGTIIVSQVLKTQLAASRQGTLIAGGLGAFVFMCLLTSISNLRMMNGSHIKSGLGEAFLAGIVGVFTAGAVHRIAITICILMSAVFLYLMTVVSQQTYDVVKAAPTKAGKKK